MKEEYNFTLTIPLAECEEAITLLAMVQANYPNMRLSRKPDRQETVRFYLSFPYVGTRTDLRFKEWFEVQNTKNWQLFGPNYGIWGLS